MPRKRYCMVVFKRDLPCDFREVILYPIADTHWADPNSNHKRILEDIAYIRDTPNVYTVLNGDLMNCAIKSSISDCYGETLSPMQELAKCVEIFAPITHKTICVVPGNHEERHYRTNGIDITRLFCQQLGIEDRYSPTTAYVFLRLGRDASSKNHHRPILYTMFVTHGNGGGGRKDGGKIQRLADYATICDADIYIAGHTHFGASFKKGFYRPSGANNSITCGQHLFVNTCASLEYGGYADGKFDPPCLDRPLIYLNGTQKEMRATI